MQVSWWEVLSVLWSGAIMMLLGVVAGGLLVYRTKRESYETFMPRRVKTENKPVNIDIPEFSFFEGDDDEPTDMGEDTVTKLFEKRSSEFLGQLNKKTTEGI